MVESHPPVLRKGHQHDETVSQKSTGQTGGNHKVAFIGVLGIDCLCEQVGEKCGGDYATVDQNVVRHDIPPFWIMIYDSVKQIRIYLIIFFLGGVFILLGCDFRNNNTCASNNHDTKIHSHT